MQQTKKNLWLIFGASTTIILTIGFCVPIYFDLDKASTISLISALIALFAAISAVLGLVYQLKSNNEWNKRQYALSQVTNNTIYSNAIQHLNKNISYASIKDPITLEAIHQYICGNKNWTPGKPMNLTSDGSEIRDNILRVLNYYETIAIGIKNDIYDENVIKRLLKGNLLKAYHIFSTYIEHRRKDHEAPKAYIDLESLVNEWKILDTKTKKNDSIT